MAVTGEVLTVIHRDGRFCVVSPAEGLCAEHAELGEAYCLLELRRGAAAGPALAAGSLRPFRSFFIKAATVALVGCSIALTASVGLAYALREAPAHAGQKAGRAVVLGLQDGLVAQLRRTTPEQEEQIRRSLREAVPLLKPYARELKPLFE
jgi:hypothetical protein